MRISIPRALSLLTCVLFLSSVSAFAQTCPAGGTTTLTGHVYAPNGTDPLPNVLVYVPSGPVTPFPVGVTCSLQGTVVSGSPVATATTAVDGSFTLTGVPSGANIPLVIQAGKWRRQFVIPAVASCTSTNLDTTLVTGYGTPPIRFPRTHLEGDIPKIAIVTGAVDALECVLRKIGIADSEFSNPPTQGGTGRINLYLGNVSAGAQYNANTPSETQLWGTQASLNQYDMVLFPCQGASGTQLTSSQQNVIDYANAGGRIFATHYSYDWLYNDPPFSGAVQWAVDPFDTNNFAKDPAIGIINTTIPKGENLAQWLQVVNAPSTFGQVPINTLRKDTNGVVSPTVEWLSDNDANLGSVTMQLTFNTPVGASSAMQCGRVLFNATTSRTPRIIPPPARPSRMNVPAAP